MRRSLEGAALLICLAFAVPCWAQQAGGNGKDFEAELRRLTGEVQVLWLLNRLGLTPEQMKELLPLAVEARDLHAQFEKDRAECRLEMEKAFRALKAEDETDRGLSPEVTSAATKASDRHKDLEESFLFRMGTLSKKVESILSKEQRGVALSYKPPVFEGGKIDPGAASGRKKPESSEEKLLREIRTTPEGGLARIETDLVKLQLEREEARRGEPYAPKARRDREAAVRGVFLRARALSDEEFEDAIDEMAEEIRPRTKLEDLQWALRNLEKGEKPSSTAIDKYLLSPWTAGILEKRLGKRED
jgi:hypothetical protein